MFYSMNPKISRRKLFAGVLAGALLHVLKPLKAVELAPIDKWAQWELNPEYVKAEFECYFMCSTGSLETFTTLSTPPALSEEKLIPIMYKRGSGPISSNKELYPLRFNLDDAGNFKPVPPITPHV